MWYLGFEGDLFCEEEFEIVIKGLQNNKTPGADSVVNDFLNIVTLRLEVRYWRLRIWLLEKGKYLPILGKPELNHCIRKMIRVSVIIIEALVWYL